MNKRYYLFVLLSAFLILLLISSCAQEQSDSSIEESVPSDSGETSETEPDQNSDSEISSKLPIEIKETHRLESVSTAVVQFNGESLTSEIVYPKLSSNARIWDNYYSDYINLSHYPVRIRGNNIIGSGLFDVGFDHGFFYIYNFKQEQYISAVSGCLLPDYRFVMAGSPQEARTDAKTPQPYDFISPKSYAYTIYNEDFSKAGVQLQFDFVQSPGGSYKYNACGFGYSPATDEYFMLYIQREAPPEEDGLKIVWFNSNGEQIGDILSVPIEDFNFGKMGQIYKYDQPVISLDDSHFLLDPFINEKVIILNAVDKTYKIYEENASIEYITESEKNKNIEYTENLNDVIAPYGLQEVTDDIFAYPIKYFKLISRPPFDIIPGENSAQIAIYHNTMQQIIAILPANYYLADWQPEENGGLTAVFGVFENIDRKYEATEDEITTTPNTEYINALLNNQPWDFRSKAYNGSKR